MYKINTAFLSITTLLISFSTLESALAEVIHASCYKGSSVPSTTCYESESNCLSYASDKAETDAESLCEQRTGSRSIYHATENYRNVTSKWESGKQIFSCTVGLRFSCRP